MNEKANKGTLGMFLVLFVGFIVVLTVVSYLVTTLIF